MAGIYLNTDVASMITALQVRKTNDKLNNSMLQQTTGLKINYAIDDPSGLVASEVMRGELASISAAKTNSERAIGMFKVADQALGLISDKLTKAKELAGLISSGNEIEANNDEFTAIMQSIARDIQTTSYSGNKLFYNTGTGAFEAFEESKFQVGTDTSGEGVVSFQLKNLAGNDTATGMASLSKLVTDEKAMFVGDNTIFAGTGSPRGYGNGLLYNLSVSSTIGGVAAGNGFDITASSIQKDAVKQNALAAVGDIDKAISDVARYRGQIGGFQKYSLESSINSLNNRFTQVTAAEADIRNADATQLTQDITSGQLLLQSGISTLLLAGQNRSYALALLG
ncbi:MAG: flagellin [Planctomycetaceae bacterium]|jgi:flagellin-like hook-associated protein FlgL|nr:flagellin [Planctomycetaceae bacterium]